MSQAQYKAFSELFSIVAGFQPGVQLPPSDVLRQRIGQALETASASTRAFGVDNQDIREMVYAVVALMDEKLLSIEWMGRQEWMAMPLQMQYFRENTAGEGFYQRLNAHLSHPHKEAIVSVFFWCMSLGFQGKYAVSGASQERNELERRALHYLNKNRNSEKYLSPHGVSRVSLGASTVSGWPIARASIALLALSIIGFFLMFFVIRVVSDKSAEEILSRFESIQVGGVNK